MREVCKPYKGRKRKLFLNFSVFPQSHSLFSASLQTFCLTVWETTWICKNTNCFAVKWGNIWYSMQQWTVLMLVLACHLPPHRGFRRVGIAIKIAPHSFFPPTSLYLTQKGLCGGERHVTETVEQSITQESCDYLHTIVSKNRYSSFSRCP